MDSAEGRLSAIATAAEAALRRSTYASMRVEDVAALVDLPTGRGRPRRGGGGRSPMWLYGEIRAKRVLAGLAAAHAWRHDTAALQPLGAVPETVTGMRAAAKAAFLEIVTFCQRERKLLDQIRAGLGDPSAHERRGGDDTPPTWQVGGPYATVAYEAWQGRCAAFAEFLQNRLGQAVQAVAPPAPDDLQIAQHLSNLATHACSDGNADPADDVAAGLTGYWFDRYLAARIGWLNGVAEAEQTLDRSRRSGQAGRHVAAAAGVLVTELLGSDVLLQRAAAEADAAHHSIAEMLAGQYSPGAGPLRDAARDLAELQCDLTSRHGLALLRQGRLAEAREPLGQSLALAHDVLGQDRARAARARTNLAEARAIGGHGVEALSLIADAVDVRKALVGATDTPTTRQRLAISEHTMVRVLIAAGRTGAARRLAQRLFQDSVRHGVHEEVARRTLGVALRAAGHPHAARQHLERAHNGDSPWYLPFSRTYRDTVLELCRCALDLAQPTEVLRLSAFPPAAEDWFRKTVSPALAMQLSVCQVLALAEDGDAAALPEAERLVALGVRLLGEEHLVVLETRRALAHTLVRADRPDRARNELLAVRDIEHAGREPVEPGSPGMLATALQLAEVAEILSDEDAVAAEITTLLALTGAGLDSDHPALLRARVVGARLAARTGDSQGAAQLLGPVVDRAPVPGSKGPTADDLPRLEEHHPVLEAARTILRGLKAPTSEGTARQASWLGDE